MQEKAEHHLHLEDTVILIMLGLMLSPVTSWFEWIRVFVVLRCITAIKRGDLCHCSVRIVMFLKISTFLRFFTIVVARLEWDLSSVEVSNMNCSWLKFKHSLTLPVTIIVKYNRKLIFMLWRHVNILLNSARLDHKHPSALQFVG